MPHSYQEGLRYLQNAMPQNQYCSLPCQFCPPYCLHVHVVVYRGSLTPAAINHRDECVDALLFVFRTAGRAICMERSKKEQAPAPVFNDTW